MAATITETIPALRGRTPAQRFARTVTNVTTMPVGTHTSFGVGVAHIDVWVPRPNTWVLQLIEVAQDYSGITVLATMGVSPDQTGESALAATYQTPESGVVQADDFRSAEAALTFALEWVCASALRQQDDHDAFAV
jgi:hypothetical protein